MTIYTQKQYKIFFYNLFCLELSIRDGNELEKYNVKRLKMLIEEIKLDEGMSKENDEFYD